MYKALFLDIDGTILKADHTYDPSTKEAIAAAKQKGVHVFLATGKPFYEIQALAQALDIDSFISFNGAYATVGNKVLFKNPFEQSTIERFLTLAKDHNHEFVLYTDTCNCYTSLEAPRVQNFIKVLQMKKNGLLDSVASPYTLGATLLGVQPADTDNYTFDPAIRISQVNVEGAKDCYDLIRTDVNKGVAVAHVLEYLGIEEAEAIAFGDGMNDKEMLQTVGHGFAMGNANPDLLPYAKYQTTSVETSGISDGLRQLGIL